MSVRADKRGPVTIITLDRPDRRNAIDRATADALAGAFRAFDGDDSASVAVLTGAGGTFCAGADLKAVADGTPNRVAEEGDGPLGPSRMLLRKPLLAAIEGHAVAGGLELALLCDMRIVAEDAVLGVFCRRFGVPLIDGGTIRLPRIVGLGRALDLVMTGRAVEAHEAHAMGLADRVVPRGRALAEAEALAQTLAALPQDCLRSDRLSVYEGLFAGSMDDALRRELSHGWTTLERGSALLGATRFAAGEGRGGS